MGCTRYSSPSGYYDQGNFSCAADLAMLAQEDLLQPRIARVTRTLSAALPFPIKGGKLFLYNNNPLLIYHYPGTTGLKTGFTEAAGRCLVGTAERDGVRLGVVILHSTEPGRQARALLNARLRGRLPPAAGGGNGNAPRRLSPSGSATDPGVVEYLVHDQIDWSISQRRSRGPGRHTAAGRVPRPGAQLA